MEVVRLRPLYPNPVWSYDCVEDKVANKRKIKCLTVMNEFPREFQKISVEYGIKFQHVIEVLSELFITNGIPEFIRSNKGPEFIGKIFKIF